MRQHQLQGHVSITDLAEAASVCCSDAALTLTVAALLEHEHDDYEWPCCTLLTSNYSHALTPLGRGADAQTRSAAQHVGSTNASCAVRKHRLCLLQWTFTVQTRSTKTGPAMKYCTLRPMQAKVGFIWACFDALHIQPHTAAPGSGSCLQMNWMAATAASACCHRSNTRHAAL